MSFNHQSSVGQQKSALLSSIPEVILRLLQKRDIPFDQIPEHLTWDLKNLPDLTQMKDMVRAAERITNAILNQEKIAVYGDYDVDGTTSCALFYYFFQMVHTPIEIFQPSRFVEGYGLHPVSIEQADEQQVKVLITVDCGITSNEAALLARDKGIDLIITDHHQDIKEEMPAAFAVVNPNRRDEPEDSPLRVMAGVGVAFAVCVQIKKILEAKNIPCPSLYPLLQLVAIGTIADLAHLSPLNLRLVRHGLKQLSQSPYPGLKVFLNQDDFKLPFLKSEKISFFIGPLINSKGRLDHPDLALKTLIAATEEEARIPFTHLEQSNKERKFIQSQVFDMAKSQVMKELREQQTTNNAEEMLINIVYEPSWHEGVIGIVASKLVETFKVPAIVFTQAKEGGLLKASARTAGTLDIFECLKKCQDLFVKFGGHQAAAGLSLLPENLSPFIKRMKKELKQIERQQRTKQGTFDIAVDFHEITPQLVKNLDSLEPFGKGNEKPIFCMKNVRLESFSILKDLHIKWQFASLTSSSNKQLLQGITFNYFNRWQVLHPETIFTRQTSQGVNVEFSLGINQWNGKEFLQLHVHDVSLA